MSKRNLLAKDSIVSHFEHGVNLTLDAFGVSENLHQMHLPHITDENILNIAHQELVSYEDNLGFSYWFDTYILRRINNTKGLKLFDIVSELNDISNKFNFPNYFHAYCSLRAIDVVKVKDLANDFLDNTKERYWEERFACLGVSKNETISEKVFTNFFKKILLSDSKTISTEFIIKNINSIIFDLELSKHISLKIGSPSGLTTNISKLSENKSWLFLDKNFGAEAWRAACHGLGHSIYSLNNPSYHDVIGVNIAATEVSAFYAQDLALNSLLNDEQIKFIRFIHLFQARLYAIRLLNDYHTFKDNDNEVYSYEKLIGVEGINNDKSELGYPKLMSIDFTIAFSYFFFGDIKLNSWDKIQNSRISNYSILEELKILRQIT